MPRSFHDAERRIIRDRLLEEGSREVARVGLRKLSIDHLVRAAGISKGSFYLFFPSKTEFILALLATVESRAQREMEEILAGSIDDPREFVTRFLRFLFGVLEREPVLAVLSRPEEAAFLMRSVPPGDLKKRQEDDDRYFRRLLARCQRRGLMKSLDPGVFAALPRMAMALFQQKQMIGADRYSPVVDFLIASITDRLAGRKSRTRKKRRSG